MRLNEITGVLSRFREECLIEKYGLPFERMVPIEEELGRVLRGTTQLTAGELKALRGSVDLHLAVLLSRFARRMASAAVYMRKDDFIQSALVAVSLDNDLLDDRDVYRTGALILDSIRRRKLDASLMLDKYLKSATDRRRSLLARQWRTAPEYMRSLRAMKFRIVEDETEFTYVDELFTSPADINTELLDKTIDQLGRERGINEGKDKRDS